MGFLGRFLTSKEDPLIQLVRDMVESQKKQAEQQQQLILKVLDVQKDQNETTRMWLGQYLTTAPNESTSLDSRLFQREDTVEWDEVLESPFKGL